MKFFAFNQGQAGDLVINTVAARLFKVYRQKHTLIMNVHKKYADLIPLFYNHPHIDGFHVWDGYEKYTEKDLGWIKKNKSDEITIWTGMPPHSCDNWYLKYHQGQECCLQNGFLETQTDLLNRDFSCYLEKWFDTPDLKGWIAFAPFAGYYNPNNDKKLTTERAQEVSDVLRSLGWGVLQIGGKDEPHLEGANKLETSYFESVKNILGCRALITTDTFVSWAASAYKFPTLGLYSDAYYNQTKQNYIYNIQPQNPNALYLDAKNVNEIRLDLIVDNLKLLIK